MIKCSPVRFLVEDVQLAERAPESCYPVDGQLIPRFLLQVVENLHGCEPFAFFALLRATEMAKEKFFQWVYPLEFPGCTPLRLLRQCRPASSVHPS